MIEGLDTLTTAITAIGSCITGVLGAFVLARRELRKIEKERRAEILARESAEKLARAERQARKRSDEKRAKDKERAREDFQRRRGEIRRVTSFAVVAESVSRIYVELRALLDQLKPWDVSRVVLLRATNGGKIPRIGFPLYTSIVYEYAAEGSTTLHDMWQQQRCDETYTSLLRRLQHDEIVIVTQEEFPVGSALGDIYRSAGTRAAVVARVGASENVFFYISANLRKNPNKLETSSIRASVRAALSAIRRDMRVGLHGNEFRPDGYEGLEHMRESVDLPVFYESVDQEEREDP